MFLLADRVLEETGVVIFSNRNRTFFKPLENFKGIFATSQPYSLSLDSGRDRFYCSAAILYSV